MTGKGSDYARIERAIRFLEERHQEQPDLSTMAAHLDLSPYHFQRLFKRWAGISPNRFLQALTLEYAKALLEDSGSVLETAFEAGLSGPGRLHDLFVTHEALSPGEYKARGQGVAIRWGVHDGPFGSFLLLVTERGICGLEFLDGGEEAALARAHERWPAADFVADEDGTRALADRIFPIASQQGRPRLDLFLSGTNFQVQVWQALLHLPPGRLAAYGDIGQVVGRRGAQRAIGNAMAANPIAFLIPCHRVIRATGAFNAYRWGATRRKALIAWESGCFAAE